MVGIQIQLYNHTFPNVYIVGKCVSQSPEKVIKSIVDKIENRIDKEKTRIGKEFVKFKSRLKFQNFREGMKRY